MIGINPGLTAAYTGHHYSGPGNHFWKCLFMSGLISTPMNAYDDFKLLHQGIGFTNIVERTTRGSGDLSKKEIKEGAVSLTAKMNLFKPKIAVFNGKGIYEIFVGHKNFIFGKQPDSFPDAVGTYVFVMPNSSARCSQLPRAVDKLPFFTALKKWRDFLRGETGEPDDSEVTFPDLQLKAYKKEKKPEEVGQSTEAENPTKRETSNFNSSSQRLTSHHNSLIQEAMMVSGSDMGQSSNPDWHQSMGQPHTGQQPVNSQMQQFNSGMHQTNSMGMMNQQYGNHVQRHDNMFNAQPSQERSQYFAPSQGHNQFSGAPNQPQMQRPAFFSRIKAENRSPNAQMSPAANSEHFHQHQGQNQGHTGHQGSFYGNYGQNQGYSPPMGTHQGHVQIGQGQFAGEQWQQQSGFNQQQDFQNVNIQQQQLQHQQQQQSYMGAQGYSGQNSSCQGFQQQCSPYIKQEPGINEGQANQWYSQRHVQNQGYSSGQWNSQMNNSYAFNAGQGNPQHSDLYQGNPNQGNANQSGSYQGNPNQSGSYQGNPNQSGSFQGNPNQSGSYQGNPNQSGSYQGNANQTGSFQGNPNQSGSFQGNANQSGSFQGNPNESGSYQGNPNQSGSFQGNPNQSGSYQGNANQSGSFQGNANQTGSFQGNPNQSGSYQGNLNQRWPQSPAALPQQSRNSPGREQNFHPGQGIGSVSPIPNPNSFNTSPHSFPHIKQENID